MNVIALDSGYGNTKVCLDCKTRVLQSVVAVPRDIGLAATGMKTTHQIRSVRFDRFHFAIGSGAWHWGEPRGSMDYTALASPERRALFYSALTDLVKPGKHTIDLLVIGLPVPLLQDKTQAQVVFEALKIYKGEHTFFNGENETYNLDIKRIRVYAQPVGTYANWYLDENLHVRSGVSKAEIAIVDIGMNTLDLYVIVGGKVEPRFIGGGKVGVRRLLELLSTNGREPEELDADLRSGRLKPSKAELESWLGEILGTIEQTWPNLRRFNTVIPSGGGAVLLGESLRLALIAKGAAVHWPEDPVTANVIGLWKWGGHGLGRSF